MINKSVSIIGGGTAGLSAAVFLAEKGFKVTVIESSPKLGGRTYSFFDKIFGGEIDNGQHILASWYHNTFDFLKLIGSYDKLEFQKQLEVIFYDNQANRYKLKALKIKQPLDILIGLLNYRKLKLKDKISAIKFFSKIKNGKISENSVKGLNSDELFAKNSQTEGIIRFFWKPFILAVFNAEPKQTSAYLLVKILKKGFIEKDGSKLVFSKVFLNELIVKPAVEYLENKCVKIITNKRIIKINFNDNYVDSLISEDNVVIKSDFYVCSVPFFEFNEIINIPGIYSGLLIPSPIVNVHFRFDRNTENLFPSRFAGLLNTNSQWIFKVSSNQICVVISAANEIAKLEKEEIILLCKEELEKCLINFSNYKIIGQRVIKEMRATFVPDKNSLSNRPKNETGINNFFLAGDWTDTEMPATIEGAVKSGRDCSELIYKKYNKQSFKL